MFKDDLLTDLPIILLLMAIGSMVGFRFHGCIHEPPFEEIKRIERRVEEINQSHDRLIRQRNEYRRALLESGAYEYRLNKKTGQIEFRKVDN